jgi:hypothetical protein
LRINPFMLFKIQDKNKRAAGPIRRWKAIFPARSSQQIPISRMR